MPRPLGKNGKNAIYIYIYILTTENQNQNWKTSFYFLSPNSIFNLCPHSPCLPTKHNGSVITGFCPAHSQYGGWRPDRDSLISLSHFFNIMRFIFALQHLLLFFWHERTSLLACVCGGGALLPVKIPQIIKNLSPH